MQTLMLINSQNYTYMRFRALPNVVSEIMIRPELGQYFFAHIFCSFLFNNVTFFMDLELLVGLETYIYLLFYRLHIFHLFPIFNNMIALPLLYSYVLKGHLISKFLFGALISSKKRMTTVWPEVSE